MTTRPLLIFAAGGTGGHLFPALAVADALRTTRPDIDIKFFCTQRPIDAQILGPTGWPRVPQPITPLSIRPWHWPGFVSRWLASRRLCHQQWQSRRPALVVGSGGFASLPPVRVAQQLGVPTALLNPDAVPGKANRFLAKRADRIFLQWEFTTDHFPDTAKLRVTGCPVRSSFTPRDPTDLRPKLGLDPNRLTLLVTGASQGARTINEAILGLLREKPNWQGWQALHLAGPRDVARLEDAYRHAAIPAKVLAFCDTMADAVAAADLVVSRAGASTLAELTAVGRPSVLLPYPFHRDHHQRINAEQLVSRQAAVLLEDRIDARENAARLGPVLERLMHDTDARQRMATAAQQMGCPLAATDTAVELLGLAHLD